MASITFDADDNEINGITFSVDYDQTCLDFDGTDSVQLKGLDGFYIATVTSNLDFTIVDPFTQVPEQVIVEITFTVSDEAECIGATAEVGFPSVPAFVDRNFTPVQGWKQDGSVKIADDSDTESAAGHTGEGFAARSLEAIRPPRPPGLSPRPA